MKNDIFVKKRDAFCFFFSYKSRGVISKDIPQEEKNEVLAMKKLQWLKTKVGLFLDPRILYLMNLPNGDSYIVLWFFLKDMAGMVNDDGKIYVSETEPLTTQLIAKSLHRRQPFIENGLRALEQVDLIERDENGLIRIVIWDELQSFHRDERRREQTNERVRRYRERRRLAQELNKRASKKKVLLSTLPVKAFPNLPMVIPSSPYRWNLS